MPFTPFLAAVSDATPPPQLTEVFYFVALPILLLAGLGFVLQRRLRLDMRTLTHLNFYLVVPSIIFYSVVNSNLSASEAGLAIVFSLLLMAALSIVTLVAARLLRLERQVRNAMLLSTVFDNSGNYGIPLQQLAFERTGFSASAISLQSVIMISQNVLTFTLGIGLLAAGEKIDLRQQVRKMLSFPPLYAVAAALITVLVRSWLGEDAARAANGLAPFWKVLVFIKESFIAIAMITLGAQLAQIGDQTRCYPVSLTVALRLIAAPVLALAVIYALGIHGFIAQVLLISACTPTAVNTMLLCLQFNNHPDFPARVVFHSTLLSPLTATVVITIAQSGILPGFGG